MIISPKEYLVYLDWRFEIEIYTIFSFSLKCSNKNEINHYFTNNEEEQMILMPGFACVSNTDIITMTKNFLTNVRTFPSCKTLFGSAHSVQ